MPKVTKMLYTCTRYPCGVYFYAPARHSEVDAGRLTTACAWLRSRSRAALREMSEDTHTQHPSLSRCSQQNEKRKAPGVCVLQSLNFDPYLAFLPLILGNIIHLSKISKPLGSFASACDPSGGEGVGRALVR